MSQPATSSPEFTIQGRAVRFPVEVRDASSGSATWLVPSAPARELIPGPGIEVAEVLPGRALLSIAIIDYRDNDLGDYNEVSIALFVRPEGSGGIPWLGNAIDMLRGRLGTWIAHLPVNQSFTQEAGSVIWGFPKTVQQIDFDYEERRATCRLVYDGVHALTLSLPRGGDRRMPERELTTYSFIEGVPHACAFRSSCEGFGVSRGGARLELGSGPIAEGLRRLGLPRRPLLCTWMEHMRGSFDPALKL